MHQSQNMQAPDQELAERAGEVTYAYDLEGNFTFLNEEGERLSGYSCEEARQMNIAELLDPGVGEQIHQQLLRGTRERVGKVYEVDIIAKDGRRVPLEVSTRIVSREGQPIEIQGIALPSVIRGQPAKQLRQRCLDEAFSFEQPGRVTLLS
ncbi:MAG TPA: PAS domain S-box protein [Pyrinomonadaceae bacterium]|nr:PAS domain S-box protein [Pyrinomonadaceae bacterium]